MPITVTHIVYKRATDDVGDTPYYLAKSREDAEDTVTSETAAYGNDPEFQFYYREIEGRML